MVSIIMHSLSYHHVRGSQKLIYSSIPAQLDSLAEERPNDECHVFLEYIGKNVPVTRKPVTYKELSERSFNVAAGLLQLGLSPGERIAIYGRAIPEWLYIDYACLRLQILQLPVPASLVYSDELLAFIREHRIKVLVLDPGHDADIVTKVRRFIPRLTQLVSGDDSGMFDDNLAGLIFFDETHIPNNSKVPTIAKWGNIKAPKDVLENIMKIQNGIDPDDLAVLFGTSGSTGTPKMVMHSHFTYSNAFQMINQINGHMSQGQKQFNDRHFSWMGGFHHFPVISGICRVHLNTTDIEQQERTKLILNAIRNEGIHYAVMLTYVLHDVKALITRGEETVPNSLMRIVSGGEKIPQDLVTFFNELIPITLLYSSSETPVLGAFDSREDQLFMNHAGEITLLYSPTATELKVVDKSGKCVPRGVPGYIVSRQPCRFLGYLNDPVKTAATISPAGWAGPGDMVIMHESGKIEVLGRETDLIIKGAVKIYPHKQEAMLMCYQKVAKAVVCGVPDPKYHEEICACVVPKVGCEITVEELRTHCSQYQPSGISLSLVPKHYIILDELPQISTGKVDKKSIRAKFVKMASIKDK